MKELTLATSTFCGPCQMIKAFISSNNLNVATKDMSDDLEFFQEHKIKNVPTLIVSESDAETQVIVGAEKVLAYLKGTSV